MASLMMVDVAPAQDDLGRVKVQMPPVRAMTGYLKIGDIKGESTDADHKDWIDVLSVDWGAADPEPSSARARKPKEIVVVGNVSKASPKLVEHIAQGTHFPEVVLDVAASPEPGAAQNEDRKMWIVKLQDARITSYQIDASGDRPTETITLNYAKIESSSDVILKGKKVREN